MSETKLVGILQIWTRKGFGFISVRESDGKPQRKYYLHVSKIISGEARPNATVRFSVDPIIEGSLPSAIDVEVLGEGGAR